MHKLAAVLSGSQATAAGTRSAYDPCTKLRPATAAAKVANRAIANAVAEKFRQDGMRVSVSHRDLELQNKRR